MDIIKEATKYYTWLYRERASVMPEKLFNLLRKGKRIKPESLKSCNKKITRPDVERAIRSMANDKSPGPDGIPAEFYKLYESMIASKLGDVIAEAHRTGIMPSTWLEGNIILIYKKKSPRDLRNYRPITLLNADYKILSKILCYRLKDVMDSSISSKTKRASFPSASSFDRGLSR